MLDTGLQSCCGDYYVLWLRLLHCADDDDDDDDVSLETWLQKNLAATKCQTTSVANKEQAQVQSMHGTET